MIVRPPSRPRPRRTNDEIERIEGEEIMRKVRLNEAQLRRLVRRLVTEERGYRLDEGVWDDVKTGAKRWAGDMKTGAKMWARDMFNLEEPGPSRPRSSKIVRTVTVDIVFEPAAPKGQDGRSWFGSNDHDGRWSPQAEQHFRGYREVLRQLEDDIKRGFAMEIKGPVYNAVSSQQPIGRRGKYTYSMSPSFELVTNADDRAIIGKVERLVQDTLGRNLHQGSSPTQFISGRINEPTVTVRLSEEPIEPWG